MSKAGGLGTGHQNHYAGGEAKLARKLTLSSIKNLVNQYGSGKISLKLPKSRYKSKTFSLRYRARRIKV